MKGATAVTVFNDFWEAEQEPTQEPSKEDTDSNAAPITQRVSKQNACQKFSYWAIKVFAIKHQKFLFSMAQIKRSALLHLLTY